MGTVPCAEGPDIAQMTIFTKLTYRCSAHPAKFLMSLLRYWEPDPKFQGEIKGSRINILKKENKVERFLFSDFRSQGN